MRKPLITFSTMLSLLLLGLSASQSSFAVGENDAYVAKAEPADKTTKLDDNDIARFSSAISHIKSFYVKQINDKKLMEDAIRGMVAGLDPHSEYLDADSYKTLLMATSGEFGGLGLEVTTEYSVLKVVTPIDDTPAFRAGVKTGDYIVALDGKLVSDMTLNEAIGKMRGEQGSQVVLTVIRKGMKKPLTFKLTREVIHIVSVKSKILDNNYGYIRISQFQEPTAKLMVAAIQKMQKDLNGNLKGLILDLRNNPGGLLESAVEISNDFLDSNKLHNKIIVTAKGRLPESAYEADATATDLLHGIPLIILINEGSASASEIVTGALQDQHRAVVMGTTSFGKGSVQTVLPLDKDHAIKLTTALYYTPSGRSIQNKGIQPDIWVENLKVAKDEADEGMLEPLKEYQLKGHLNNNGLNNGSMTDNSDLSKLAQEDFQLYESLKILKAMNKLDQQQLVAGVARSH